MLTFSPLVSTLHFYAYLSYKLTNKPQGLGTEIKLIKLLFLLYFVLVSIINELIYSGWVISAWHLQSQVSEIRRTDGEILNPFSAGTDFMRQNLTSVDVRSARGPSLCVRIWPLWTSDQRGDRFYTSESDLCRRQISAGTVFMFQNLTSWTVFVRQNLTSVDGRSARGLLFYVIIWRL